MSSSFFFFFAGVQLAFFSFACNNFATVFIVFISPFFFFGIFNNKSTYTFCLLKQYGNNSAVPPASISKISSVFTTPYAHLRPHPIFHPLSFHTASLLPGSVFCVSQLPSPAVFSMCFPQSLQIPSSLQKKKTKKKCATVFIKLFNKILLKIENTMKKVIQCFNLSTFSTYTAK